MIPPGDQLPQPWQDMRNAGTQQDDWLLSLDDKAQAHRGRLMVMARLLRQAILVGHPAPIVTKIGDRVRYPRQGDLVVETTSAIWNRRPESYLGFGFLLAMRAEATQTDQEWETQLAEWGGGARDSRGQRPSDDAWYVQYGPAPGDVCRWVNCQFMALPAEVVML